MITCPECGKENPDAAEFCMKCGKKLIKDTNIEELNESEPVDFGHGIKIGMENQPRGSSSSKRIGNLRIFSILLVVVVLILFAIWFIPQHEESQTLEYKAWERAKELVKDELKSPATAKFPDYNENFVSNEGYGSWEVTVVSYSDYEYTTTIHGTKFNIYSHVDAENSYGALVRESFSVSIIRTDEGGLFNHDGWVTDYVHI